MTDTSKLLVDSYLTDASRHVGQMVKELRQTADRLSVLQSGLQLLSVDESLSEVHRTYRSMAVASEIVRTVEHANELNASYLLVALGDACLQAATADANAEAERQRQNAIDAIESGLPTS